MERLEYFSSCCKKAIVSVSEETRHAGYTSYYGYNKCSECGNRCAIDQYIYFSSSGDITAWNGKAK